MKVKTKSDLVVMACSCTVPQLKHLDILDSLYQIQTCFSSCFRSELGIIKRSSMLAPIGEVNGVNRERQGGKQVSLSAIHKATCFTIAPALFKALTGGCISSSRSNSAFLLSKYMLDNRRTDIHCSASNPTLSLQRPFRGFTRAYEKKFYGISCLFILFCLMFFLFSPPVSNLI